MAERSVLVTGAAQGIGRAVAEEFLRQGYLVGAYDVDVARLEEWAGEAGAGDRLLTGLLDVRDKDHWTRVLRELTDRTGGTLDVLVNNAGVLASGRFAEIPLEDQRRIIDVNVTGVMTGCWSAHAALRSARGTVINLCSAAAIYGQAELVAYSASKFAVRSITEGLDLEWRSEGIRVRAVWPLFTATSMVDGMDVGSSRTLGVRLGPQDVARTVVSVAQEKRGWGSVHRAVGRQAQSMLVSSATAPSWLLRLTNRKITQQS